jgi:hypothetical protein
MGEGTKHEWTVADGAEGAEGYFNSVATRGEDVGAGWEEWIFRGEKGVWEVGGYIRAKCAVEITLDHCITRLLIGVVDGSVLDAGRGKGSGERTVAETGRKGYGYRC